MLSTGAKIKMRCGVYTLTMSNGVIVINSKVVGAIILNNKTKMDKNILGKKLCLNNE